MPLHRLCPLLSVLILLAGLPVAGWALSVPDTITLNEKGRLYEPFAFDHARHIRETNECSSCHHHTTGTLVEDANCVRCHRNSGEAKVVSCRGCHSADPFSVASLKELSSNPKQYHRDKPGLKGAMHQSCIGCHSRQQSGPVGCEECHTRKAAGHALYNSGPHNPAKPAAKKQGGH